MKNISINTFTVLFAVVIILSTVVFPCVTMAQDFCNMSDNARERVSSVLADSMDRSLELMSRLTGRIGIGENPDGTLCN